MKKHIFLAALLIAIGVVFRVIPHVPNVAPIGALALFSGFYFRGWKGLLVPLGAQLLGDALVGFYDRRLMAAVYASFALSYAMGKLVRRDYQWGSVLAGSLAGALIFFFVTNGAVWLLSVWYPHTLSGLFEAYAMGLPFFRNSLVGDILFSAVFFGVYELEYRSVFRKYANTLQEIL